ncbi:MAG: 16S rRNA (uracil(1498)-N(3))-methyltransferase [Cytophagales bacterium]|nr:16S rRNA (uracil(1498)-N(3))-methyltransferase [Armatimonadota bacterium]
MSSTPRFFVPPAAIRGDTATLPPEAAHHIRNVLRMEAGQSIVLHDGLGFAYSGTLTEVAGKAAVVAAITDRTPVAAEPTTRITVAQALPKTSDKIEQVLQHGTEVGAAGFLFFAGRRSVARLAEGEKIDKRLARWRGIVLGAAEQSGRGILPTVEWAGLTPDLVRRLGDFDHVLVLHEAATFPLADALRQVAVTAIRLLIVVGPEGGLDDQSEVPLLVGAGGVPLTLGPRILRTETAALVALAQILFAREMMAAGGVTVSHAVDVTAV